MAERRIRLYLNIPSEIRDNVEADAQAEGISINDLAQKALQIRRSLHLLSEAGINIVLETQAGEPIDRMSAALFRTFLESDPALIDHFIGQNPTKSQ